MKSKFCDDRILLHLTEILSLLIDSCNKYKHSSLYTNTTLDSILEQELGLPITDSDSALLNHLQNAATHDDEQIEEEDNNNDGIDKNDGVDYGSSNNKNEDDENEIDLSIEELNDRILERVTDQLRESGIDFPP